MRAMVFLAAALAAGGLAAGCFEGKTDVTLNPDGTGKIAGDLTFRLEPPWTGKKKEPPAKPAPSVPSTPSTTVTSTASAAASTAPAEEMATPDEQMKEAVYNILKRSSGIDAWKDVSFELLEHNRVRLSATGYFRDLSHVRIYPDAGRTSINFHSDGGNGLMLVLASPKEIAKKGETPRAAREIPEEELAKKMKDMRAGYQAMRGNLGMTVAGLNFTFAFHVPGTPTDIKGLEPAGNVLSYTAEGQKVMQALDAVVADNATLARMILAGERLTNFESAIPKNFFSGAKGECWARIMGPFREQFDYKAECDAAKKGQAEMMTRLGLDKPKTARPPSKPADTPAKKPSDSPSKKPAAAPTKKPGDTGLPGKLPPVNIPKDLPDIPMPILPGL